MSITIRQPTPISSLHGSTSVQTGYKSTEIGMIPDDWDIKPLSEVCLPHGIVRGPFGGMLKKEIFVASGFKVYEQRNAIYKSCSIGSYYIDQAKYSKMQRFSISPGDFIISCSGTIGRIYQIPHDAPQGVINQALLKLTTDEEIVNDRYFYILFEWDDFQARIIDSTQGGAMKNLVGMEVFKTTLVVRPPLPEQNAIATALSDVDGLIVALEKLIAKKRAIKKAAMQQLLTAKTRLPGFTGNWKEQHLSELASITMGQSPPSQFYNLRGDGLPLIQGNADIENRYTIERVWTTQASKRCDAGDLLLTVRAPVGAVGIATKSACLGRGVCGLKPYGSSPFLFQALVYSESRWKILEQGSTFTSANSTQVGQFCVWVSKDIDEQHAIATVFSDMDAEITALERRRDKTKQIKQGMMQQLLTGRIRLVKLEVSTAEVEKEQKGANDHNWYFNEAVVISVLANRFGSQKYPLGRKRYTKFSYLLHRYADRSTEGYLKKAAGPYNPKTKYGGPEKIALQNGYIHEHTSGKLRGFVAADNITKAEEYFEKWYGSNCIQWLEQFHYKTNDELELLSTVDMASEELRSAHKNVDTHSVKNVLRSNPEWKPKLDRKIFSDANISQAIGTCLRIFC